jgi:hypothetical protein
MLFPEPNIRIYISSISTKIKTIFKTSNIATGWTTKRIGVRFPVGAEDFSFHQRVQTSAGAQTAPIKWRPVSLSRGRGGEMAGARS